MPFNELVLADGDTPVVMEAVIHAMIDFRREMLDNLKLSLEYHTEQLEEIKFHVEHVIEEQENRFTLQVVKLQDNIETMQSQIVELQGELKQLEVIKNHTEDVIEEQQEQLTKRVLELQDHVGQMKSQNVEVQKKTLLHLDHTSLQLNKIANALDQPNLRLVPSACDEIKSSSSGTFFIRHYGSTEKPFKVLCNFDNKFNLGGGWTVFQRRLDGSVDFYQNWTMYKDGFGDVNGEHWLGLEKLHQMTRSGGHELLVLLEDFEGKAAYAFYDGFKIGNEAEKYKLTVGKYSGTASDSLSNHSGMLFSTLDQDNDRYDCAYEFEGAWWFHRCYNSHLNGRYYQKGNHLDKSGVEWIDFPSANYSLKSTTMMFRSRN
ncbi:AGAP012000-PA-like protein [Anopheles sinensis]|uniref:AGAP012000-PA-like protein n=1 Tax=Anopheles sinensis TaxID=74873 RepID=A0A084WK29_ANOSI|nr:AGAP012000-PA-like protein [Anopheles sinensis]